jgi:ATP-grasp ribosomal peptide maturase
MTVLVLSEDLDPTVDALVDELTDRRVPVFRADTAWFPQHLTLDAELGEHGWSGALSTTGRAATLGTVRSVWYRNPTAFQLPDGLSGPEQQHARYEAKFGLGGVLWSLPALWVNHPARQADLYKPTQLVVAQACGLATPRTLITNREDAVRRFVRDVGGRVVTKPLGFASIVEDGGRRPLWTRLLTDDDLSDLRGVDATAHLFQQFVDKDHEVRLTVVGQRMFAAAIHSGSDAARVDFRSDYDALTITVTCPPASVVAGVEAFMRHFCLTFGAFDFVVDPAGRWWFLECNPAGQYGFVESATGLPITTALADLLEKGTA